jgi:hypothetical protein
MESNRDAEAYRQSQPWADERVTGLQREDRAQTGSGFHIAYLARLV